jgi:hypothetical protein
MGLLAPGPLKAEGPSLVSCPRLLIQHIRSYPLYFWAIFSVKGSIETEGALEQGAHGNF